MHETDVFCNLDVYLVIGLREGTKELGLWDKQTLFKDPAFDKLNQFLLSTSQVCGV